MAYDHAGHSHPPGHGHADHGHDLAASSQNRVLMTFWLITVFMVVEAVGGWWAGSLTLIADAGHMLTDSGALALAWFATRQTQRPSDAEKSYGHGRFSVLAALVNGLGLIAIVGWIAIEAVQRLISPTEVKALPMLAIAVTGLAVNAGAFFLLHGADRDNLNIKGAILHVIGDLLASVAAVVAAVVILVVPAWSIADPILSMVASGLILRGAVGLVGKSWHVLMEGTPAEVNVAEVAAALEAIDGVQDIHHLHAWSLVPGKTLITLHAQLAAGHTSDAVLARMKQTLAERFDIDHSTIQIEGACADAEDPCEDPVRGASHSDKHAQTHDHAHGRKVAATR
jgi:cobalt-zinc-cadmium efflux system protein